MLTLMKLPAHGRYRGKHGITSARHGLGHFLCVHYLYFPLVSHKIPSLQGETNAWRNMVTKSYAYLKSAWLYDGGGRGDKSNTNFSASQTFLRGGWCGCIFQQTQIEIHF